MDEPTRRSDDHRREHWPIWMPEPVPLPDARRRKWRLWAQSCREQLLAIKRAQLWTPQRDCPNCTALKRPIPPDGCPDHHPYADWTPNAWQTKPWYSTADVVCGTAGSGAGKSNCAAGLVVCNVVTIPPLWFLENERIDYMARLPLPRWRAPPHKVWIVGPKRESLEDGIVQWVRAYLDGTGWLARYGEHAGPGGKRLTNLMEMTSGSTVEIRVQDQGKEAFESAAVDAIFEDEEFSGESGDACRSGAMARIGRRNGRYYFLVTAIDTATRGGDSYIAKNVLTPGMGAGFNKDLGLSICVTRSSTWENTHQSYEQRLKHDALNRDPVTGEPGPWYNVRVLGYATGINVSAVLPQGSLEWMLQQCKAPIARGGLSDTSGWRQRNQWKDVPGWVGRPIGKMAPGFISDPVAGRLSIWEWPDKTHHYTVGADAGNAPDGNHGHAAAAWVLDRWTGRYVACWWGVMNTIDFALELVRLGWFYNHAWICVALEGPGRSCNHALAGAGVGQPRYDRLYRDSSHDGWEDVESSPGYAETGASRQAYLDALKHALNPTTIGDPTTIPIRIPDAGTVREMLSVRMEKTGKIVYPEHSTGDFVSHCDRMVGAAMAWMAHLSPSCPMPYPAKLAPVYDSLTQDAGVAAFEAEEALIAQAQRTGPRRLPVRRLPVRRLQRS